jgi:Phage portal protein
MAWPFRRTTSAEIVPVKANKSLLAAAVNLRDQKIGKAAWHARSGEDGWQRNAWHYYDTLGELNAAVRWIANAVSRAELYAAEVDVETGQKTGPTDNPVVQAVTNSILNGPEKRSQAQSHMTINWLIAGELFVIVRPRTGQPDEWLVLSSTEVDERGGTFRYTDPITGQRVELTNRDVFARVWSPHPRKQSHADSSVRSALPILREVERTSMNIMARLDSRLVGSGILLVPEEMDFPLGDGDDVAGVQGFIEILVRSAEASLQDPGSARSQVPLIVPAPAEMIQNGAFQHLAFTTELSQEIVELRESAIRRLAMALDIPPETMTGMGESSHWNAWQIEETTWKIHVAPLLEKLADAFTQIYLHPTLAAMGVPDPERYILDFNVTEIVSRPDKFAELNTLFDKGLITDEYLLSEVGIPDDAVPSREEELRRIAITLATSAPTLIEVIPQLAEVIGFDAPEPVPVEPVAQAVPAAEENEPRAIPERPAQGDERPSDGLTAAAEMIVFDALTRAGGRLLTREHRGQFSHVPKHELHTVIRASDQAIEAAMEGSFQHVALVAQAFNRDPEKFYTMLRVYCEQRLFQGLAHNREVMREWLTR